MSRDYNNICKNVLKSNDEMYIKDSLYKNMEDIRKELKVISNKIDRIYSLLVNFIDNKEF